MVKTEPEYSSNLSTAMLTRLGKEIFSGEFNQPAEVMFFRKLGTFLD
jgi:hypothetical protein